MNFRMGGARKATLLQRFRCVERHNEGAAEKLRVKRRRSNHSGDGMAAKCVLARAESFCGACKQHMSALMKRIRGDMLRRIALYGGMPA